MAHPAPLADRWAVALVHLCWHSFDSLRCAWTEELKDSSAPPPGSQPPSASGQQHTELVANNVAKWTSRVSACALLFQRNFAVWRKGHTFHTASSYLSSGCRKQGASSRKNIRNIHYNIQPINYLGCCSRQTTNCWSNWQLKIAVA